MPGRKTQSKNQRRAPTARVCTIGSIITMFHSNAYGTEAQAGTAATPRGDGCVRAPPQKAKPPGPEPRGLAAGACVARPCINNLIAPYPLTEREAALRRVRRNERIGVCKGDCNLLAVEL